MKSLRNGTLVREGHGTRMKKLQIDQTATGSVQIIVEELIENKSNQKLLTPKCIGVGALPLFCVRSALWIKISEGRCYHRWGPSLLDR
jgi:hypothetical protein